MPFELFGQAWVLFRDAEGRPACVRDECAHRACPLSLGRVVNGEAECPYHGWRFNGDGVVTSMPSTMLCKGVAVSSLPCLEADGFVWIWPGWEEPSELPTFAAPPGGYHVHAGEQRPNLPAPAAVMPPGWRLAAGEGAPLHTLTALG